MDSSVVLTLAFQEQRVADLAPVLEALETTSAVVPATWEVEIANAFAVAERRKRIDPARIASFRERIRALPIEVDVEGALEAVARAVPMARLYHVSAYDALYLELAKRRGLPFATLDQRLASAASQASIELMLG